MILSGLSECYQSMLDLINQPLFNKFKGLTSLIKNNSVNEFRNDNSFELDHELIALKKCNFQKVFSNYSLVLDQELAIIEEQKEGLYYEFEESFNKLMNSFIKKFERWTEDDAKKFIKDYFVDESLVDKFLSKSVILSLRRGNIPFEPYVNNKKAMHGFNMIGRRIFNYLKSNVNGLIRKINQQQQLINNYQPNCLIELNEGASCNICFKPLIDYAAFFDCGFDCYCHYHLECVDMIASGKSKLNTYSGWTNIGGNCYTGRADLKEKVDQEDYKVCVIEWLKD